MTGNRRPRTRANWAGVERWTPEAEAMPGSLDELVELVAGAAERGGRVKVIGAGHSFTPIAATDGTQVSLDALTGITRVDPDTRRVRVLAGTPLHVLCPALAAHGLALANMGDIDRQSLGGALGTSTHGTGLGFTGYAGTVTGLRLLTADGTLRWLDSGPLFEAARVGLGALGIITEVELQAVPAFLLRAVERAEPLAGVVESFVERSRAADHLEFYWFPGTEVALTKENTRLVRGAEPAGREPAGRGPGVGRGAGLEAERRPVPRLRAVVNDELLSNGGHALVCRVARAVPRAAGALNRLAARLLDEREYTDHSYRVFVSSRRVRFTEMEYALPLERFEEAFAGLRSIADGMLAAGHGISFPVEVRTAAGDDVWLSTAHGRDSVYIAVHRFHGDPADSTAEYFRAAEELFVALGGRPHWGKVHTRDADWAAGAYPRCEDFLRVRDEVDPGRVFGNAYLERVLGV